MTGHSDSRAGHISLEHEGRARVSGPTPRLPLLIRPVRMGDSMNIRIMIPAGILLGLVFVLAAPAPAVESTSLTTLIPDLPHDRLLEVTLDDGSIHTGYLVRARIDSLVLGPWGEEAETSLAVAEIVRLREKRSNAARGAGWGAVSGTLIGGSLGILSGLYLSSINDSEESDVGPVLGGAAIGAAMGAGVFGLTGWGIGALTGSWRTLYGPEEQDIKGDDHAPTRLALDLGYGSLKRSETTFDGFTIRLGLNKPISSRIQMGPHLEYVNLGGTSVNYGNGYEEYVSNDDSFHASFGMKANFKRTGFGPYAAAGFGWYWGNGGYLGGHLGGGLRYLNRGGTDFNLDGRYHFNVTEIDKGSDAGYWTLTAGFSFEL